jgi:hypothetical protein
MGIGIFKNSVSGTRYSAGYNTGYLAANTSSIVYLNGTSDYIQIFVNLPSGYIYGASGANNFCMHLVS